MDVQELIAKLEAASEGSFRLDDAIYEWFLVKSHDPGWKHFTQGLDAALTLVPEGWEYAVFSTWQHKTMQPGAAVGKGPHLDLCNAIGATGSTPALALTIAALKARAS